MKWDTTIKHGTTIATTSSRSLTTTTPKKNKRIRPRRERRIFIVGNNIFKLPTETNKNKEKKTKTAPKTIMSVVFSFIVVPLIIISLVLILMIMPSTSSAFVVVSPAIPSSSSYFSNIENNNKYNGNKIIRIPPRTNSNSSNNNDNTKHNNNAAVTMMALLMTSNTDDDSNVNDNDVEDDAVFLNRELEQLESMEKMLEEIEDYCRIEGMCDDDDDDDDNDNDDNNDNNDNDRDIMDDDESDIVYLNENMKKDLEVGELDDMETFLSLFEETTTSPASSLLYDDEDKGEILADRNNEDEATIITGTQSGSSSGDHFELLSMKGLEDALLQGVVPVNADVGSDTLPGDWGFDPMNLAEKDYIHEFQYRFLDLLPGGNPNNDPPPEPRPSALILRDYREAEIRHGRLAMLAVIIWPIEEKLDQLLLDEDDCGPILYGPITLPYLPLLMTLIIMLLGYLDIYANVIKEEENIGDAFLPGDCFWDPLKMLQGAPPTMERNMQERELFNGRVAMIAFAAFVFEELTSHRAIIDIPGNEILFAPAYQIPSVREWLDSQFLTYYSN